MRLNRSHMIVFLCALLLAGCTPDAPATNPTDPAEDALPAATDAPTADVEQSAGSATTITFGEQSYFCQLYQPLIDRFNAENPAIRVQFVAVDDAYSNPNISIDAVYARIMRMADTATLQSASPTTLKQLMHAGLVGDLKPFIDADAAFDRADFYPGMLESAAVANGVYLLPRSNTVALVSYNKDLFAQRGVPLPAPNATWRDLRAAASQIATKTGGKQDYGFGDLFNQEPFSLELTDAGHDLNQPAAANLKLDSPEAVAALDRAGALVRTNAVYLPAHPPGDNGDYDLTSQLIRNQRIGIWDQTLDGPPPAFKISLLPSPYDTTRGYPAGYIISGGSRHAEAAWRWLAFLSANEPPYANQVYLGIVPARKSFAARSSYWKRLDQDDTAVINAILARLAAPAVDEANPIAVHRELLTAAVRAVASGKSAKQAAAAAQTALDQFLAAAPAPSATAGPLIVDTPIPQVAQPNAVPITFGTTTLDDAALAPLVQTFTQQHPEIAVRLTSLRGANTTNLSTAAANVDCFDSFRIPRAADHAALLDL